MAGAHRRDILEIELEGLGQPMIKTVFGHYHLPIGRDHAITGRLLRKTVMYVVAIAILKCDIKYLFYIVEKRIRHRHVLSLLLSGFEHLQIFICKRFLTTLCDYIIDKKRLTLEFLRFS